MCIRSGENETTKEYRTEWLFESLKWSKIETEITVINAAVFCEYSSKTTKWNVQMENSKMYKQFDC